MVRHRCPPTDFAAVQPTRAAADDALYYHARWSSAASECHRGGPSAARNNWTAQQFLDSAHAGGGAG